MFITITSAMGIPYAPSCGGNCLYSTTSIRRRHATTVLLVERNAIVRHFSRRNRNHAGSLCRRFAPLSPPLMSQSGRGPDVDRAEERLARHAVPCLRAPIDCDH